MAIDRMPLGWRVQPMLDDLQQAFNRTSAQYTMSAEKRQKLEYRFLVEVERK